MNFHRLKTTEVLAIGIGQCLHCCARVNTVLCRYDKHWRPMHNIAVGIWELHGCGWFAGDNREKFTEQISYVPFTRYSEFVQGVPSSWRYGSAAELI